jgi:general secretion pathway protein M
MRDAILQRWAAFSARERVIVGAGGAAVAASLVFVLAVDPLLEHSERMDRQIARKQRAVRELAGLGAEYGEVRARLARLETKMEAGKGKFALLPFLEEATTAAQVRDRISAMQPQSVPSSQGYKETAVELRLEGVGWPNVVKLLTVIEDAPYLVEVKRLQIKPRFDAPHLLEATLLVSTYEKEG